MAVARDGRHEISDPAPLCSFTLLDSGGASRSVHVSITWASVVLGAASDCSDWGFWASFAWESWKKDETGTWAPGILKGQGPSETEKSPSSSDSSPLLNTIEVGHKVGSLKQVCRNAAYLPERLSTSCQHLIVFTHPKNVAVDFFESSQRVCLLETTEQIVSPVGKIQEINF